MLSSDIEAVIIAVPNPDMPALAIAAARRGKHVLMEKPIANDLATAQRVAEAISEAGVHLVVGHSARLSGGCRKLKELIAAGAIGQVNMAEANFSNDRALEPDPTRWIHRRENVPGGPLMQLLSHHFDTLNYLLGPIDRVAAFTQRFSTTADVDDVSQVICRMQSGVLCYAGSSWSTAGTYFLNVYGTEGVLSHEVDVEWWDSGFDVDEHSRLLIQPRGKGISERQEVPFQSADMHRTELEQLAEAIRHGRRPEVGAQEAIAAVTAIRAAIRSAEEGRTIALSELRVATRTPIPPTQ